MLVRQLPRKVMTFRGLRLLSPLSPRHAWGHPFSFTLCLLRAQGLGNTQTSVFLVVWAAHFDPVYERVTSRQAGPLESMTTNPSQGFPAFLHTSASLSPASDSRATPHWRGLSSWPQRKRLTSPTRGVHFPLYPLPQFCIYNQYIPLLLPS